MVNLFYLDKDPQKCAKFYCDKHVNKILVEILQILSQLHHFLDSKDPPYKQCLMIKPGLAPLRWAMTSKSNYKYCADLAYFLFKEYQFRYKKEDHKCQAAIIWLQNNIPDQIQKKNRTKFLLTDNTKIYQDFFSDDVKASRLAYVDYKCKKDKWTRREIPKWYLLNQEYSYTEKQKIIKRIKFLVNNYLPDYSIKNNLYPNNSDDFFRIAYDNLFEQKWESKIKQYPNMFNSSQPLIDQLGLGHLLKLEIIINSLKCPDILNKLNQQSLSYRKRSKKDFNINY